jgi:excisionase family DNA binding protein
MPIRTAVESFGLSRSTIYRCLSSGEIIARKQGRSTLIETVSLQDYIAAMPKAEFRGAPRSA